MPVITTSCTFLKYGNVTISIPHDTIITHDDLNEVSKRVHSLYKSLRSLVEKYAQFLGKITIDYGKLYLKDESFDNMHKDALESEFIANAQDSLIRKAFDKLHKAYKEFKMYLSSNDYFCERNLANYFATKDFYDNCVTRNKAMIVSGNDSYTSCQMYGYEFDCSLPKFND